jgi:hypothetical protein
MAELYENLCKGDRMRSLNDLRGILHNSDFMVSRQLKTQIVAELDENAKTI